MSPKNNVLIFRMFEPGLSPMTDLAMNLSDTSLNSLTPIQDSKVVYFFFLRGHISIQ